MLSKLLVASPLPWNDEYGVLNHRYSTTDANAVPRVSRGTAFAPLISEEKRVQGFG